MTIRQITEEDASAFCEIQAALENEPDFCMMDSAEDAAPVDSQSSAINKSLEEKEKLIAFCRGHIRDILGSGNSMLFLALEGEKVLGYIGIFGGRYDTVRHSAHIAIGVRSEARGKGAGAALMEAGETWARSVELKRLELEVVADNAPAIALYGKMGFEVEGIKRKSLLIGGNFRNEFLMSKILS